MAQQGLTTLFRSNVQILSPVDHSSAFAADEYRELCWPDGTSS